MATPYGPPEPLRPGFEKFKRDSKAAASLLAETDGDDDIAKKRDARKVEINFSNNEPIKNLRPKAEDLIAAQTKIDVEQIEKKDVVIEKKTKTTGGKKYKPESKKNVVVVDENLQTNIVDEENNGDDDFYDSKHSPQAEPLSLRQNTKPRSKTEKKKESATRRAEYRPGDLVSRQEPTNQATSTIASKKQEDENVFVPLFIYEAVPTTPRQEGDLHLDLAKKSVKTAENILDDIYTESVPDSSNPTVVDLLESAFDPDLPVVEFREREAPRAGAGIQIAEEILGPSLAVPAPGSRKNHHKRKIDIKDFNKNPVAPNPYLYLLKQEYPTLYRSQTDLASAVSAAGYPLPAGNIPVRSKNGPNINAEDYEHLYQTIFGEADLVQTPQKLVRKVRVPKQLAAPHFLSPGSVQHHERLRLVQSGYQAA